MLGNEEKKSLLSIIKTFLHIEEHTNKNNDQAPRASTPDYAKYRFPISEIKFNRDEINER